MVLAETSQLYVMTSDDLMVFFDQWIQRPWVWGESDCCQFVGAYLEYLNGENPAKAFDYRTESEAQNLIDEHGGLCGLVSRFLGEPVSVGCHGMIALVNKPQLLGVVYRDRIVARTANDINDIPLRRGEAFWWPS